MIYWGTTHWSAFAGLRHYIPLYRNPKKMHLHMHLFEKYEGKGQRKLIVG